ncbi:hypothetical protein FHT79_006156 [Rhizobium sp. BK212]|uniref:hypothetical protein n=1 Tax=Rhizobium sp. BK212 TaxID=2587074 RepID=UPI001404CEE3|nr:hypothetical protein [Rhizobium sp. BK212]MBB4218932.1 hypothetical protein [Rhizobium sp. BK212]
MKQSYGAEAASGKGKHAYLSTFRILRIGFGWPCGRWGEDRFLESWSTAYPQPRKKSPIPKGLESFSDSAFPRTSETTAKSFQCFLQVRDKWHRQWMDFNP